MKKLLTLVLWFALTSLASAQTFPLNNIPMGKGPGQQGWTPLAPGANGSCLIVTAGAPAFVSCGFVPTSRTINTTSPLTGGGDLSADRTFALSNIPVSLLNSGTNASVNTVWAGNATWLEPQAFRFTPTNASPAATTIQLMLQRMPVMCETYSGGCTPANIIQAMTDAAAAARPYWFNGDYTITTGVALTAPSKLLLITGRGGLVAGVGLSSPLLDIKNATNGVYITSGIAFDCASRLAVPSAIKIWSDGAGGTTNNKIYDPVIVNCRRGIQYGDSGFTDFTVDANYIEGGYVYNTAQAVAAYGSQTGVRVNNFLANVGNTSLATTLTGTCTGTTLAASALSSTGYLAKDDYVTGTGIPAGSYIVTQTSGSAGQAGNYTMSQVCTSAANALTARPAPWAHFGVGATFDVVGGYVQSAQADGRLFHSRALNSGTHGFPYARFNVIGATVEGGDLIHTTDTDGVGAPGEGAFYMTATKGDFSQNTNCYVTLDAAWTGKVGIENNRLFATSARTAANVCANNAGAKIYVDAQSFGTNMLQGTAGFTGGTQTFKIVNTNHQFFTATGTYTRNTAAFRVFGECIGGGGSGGSVAGVAATFLAAAGGGGGGYAGASLTSAQIGVSQAVTIGAGGTAPASGNNNGNAGGASSIGALVVAGGGAGGGATSGTGTVGSGGSGGTGTTGGILIGGDDGGGGSGFATAGNQAFYTGRGGGSGKHFGGQTNTASGASAGSTGKNYGGGGSGATSIDTTNRAGGAGAPGYCTVIEYLMQ